MRLGIGTISALGAALLLANGAAAREPAPQPAAASDPFSFLFNATPAARPSEGRPQASAIPREVVAYTGGQPAGTIIIATSERRLYYVLPGGQAIRYGVGVGRPGFEWSGVKYIASKREWPDWTPPAQMLRRRPDLPRHMEGGISNPLGARAMYLSGSMYRIHGSNEPETIGQAVSSGCIRMTNDDVVDLYDRAKVGTRVIVQR
jgi:lipoprotein-anchoring transpeptidase ErfK/SrfK